MTIPIWPTSLRQRFFKDGYSASFEDGRLRSPMEIGPPKVRRRMSLAVKPVQGSMRLTLDQFARLERFWREDTAGGVNPFWFPDQDYDDVGIEFDGGEELLGDGDMQLIIASSWLAQFGDPAPKYSVIGPRLYQVDMALIVFPPI